MHSLPGSLTEAQLRHYHEEGYLPLPDLLDPSDLQGVRQAMSEKVSLISEALLEQKLISDKLESLPFEKRLAALFENLDDKDFLQFGRGWRDRLPGYYDLMSNPKILDAVESLIGGEIFANPVYNVRPKVPKVAAGAVPWHQDKSYWPDANANPVITVWIAVVDSTVENGCLHVWPRTHRTKMLSYRTEEYSGTGFLEIDSEEFIREAERKAVALPMKAGGAILFNDRCIHMSTPNNSKAVRWSVDLRYQPTDQDPMLPHGAGFLARSHLFPERVATLDDWMNERLEHSSEKPLQPLRK